MSPCLGRQPTRNERTTAATHGELEPIYGTIGGVSTVVLASDQPILSDCR